jgi:hypothetical protein
MQAGLPVPQDCRKTTGPLQLQLATAWVLQDWHVTTKLRPHAASVLAADSGHNGLSFMTCMAHTERGNKGSGGTAAAQLCVVMWGGRSFGLHISKVRAKDRGHTYSLHRTHMGCLTWTVRAYVL